jgi:hypothetical protein
MSPQRVERLDKTLSRVAREQGLDQERLRRWVSFLALCSVLERAVDTGVIDTYYLKGGVALELRFASAARATKDLDLGLTGDLSMRLQKLEDALRLGFDEFTFRLKGSPYRMVLADTARVEVAVQYKTRAWQTIEVDVGPGEAEHTEVVEPAISGLCEMGLPKLPQTRCLGLDEQVAQKLHACTGPQRADRARDVLDILLVELLGRFNENQVRLAAIRIFAERATHIFPPILHCHRSGIKNSNIAPQNWGIQRPPPKKSNAGLQLWWHASRVLTNHNDPVILRSRF